MNQINCTILDPSLLPKYETQFSSGMDLKANQYSHSYDLGNTLDFPDNGILLFPFQRILVKTGLRIQLPEGHEAQIRPRSGLALKQGITVLNTPGTIDSDYVGEVGVILINLSDDPFKIKKGDRIAQMVFQKVEQFELNIVNELSNTVRGEGGFGSTNKEGK